MLRIFGSFFPLNQVSRLPSCLTTAFPVFLVFVCFALSCLTFHMPSRTTRKCKETLLQVKQRLVREQKNRTDERRRELLDDRESESDSGSEVEQTSSVEVNRDSLSVVRRDLYFGLLCLLLLLLLHSYWFRSTCCWVCLISKVKTTEGQDSAFMQLFISEEQRVVSELKVAVINLEQWEVLDPKSKYKIPPPGKIDSPGILVDNITCKDFLGYIYDWFARPVKDKKYLRHAFVTGKSGYTRRSSLKSFYIL